MRVQTTRYGTRELTARRPLSAEQRLEMMRSTPETGASASRSNSSRSSARAIFLAVSWSDWGPCRALSVPTVCAAETAATICGQSAGGEQSDREFDAALADRFDRPQPNYLAKPLPRVSDPVPAHWETESQKPIAGS
jgi:hypothetical protein